MQKYAKKFAYIKNLYYLCTRFQKQTNQRWRQHLKHGTGFMTTTQRNLNEMVKQNLSINGSAKLAHPVTVTLKCWNGWKDAPRTFELTEVVRIGKAGVVHFSDQFVFLRISELSDADCKALQGALQSMQKIYAIKDNETDSWHGEFPSIRAAINFIHKCYADRKMSIWRYEGGTKYTRVIYK